MEDLRHSKRAVVPIVNFSKCEAKGPCVEVCPYDVFEIQNITESDYNDLTFVGKLKTYIHGKKKAYTVNADKCKGCGLCISACPEKAITLVNLNNEQS